MNIVYTIASQKKYSLVCALCKYECDFLTSLGLKLHLVKLCTVCDQDYY